MKLATYRHKDGAERLGVIINDEVIDVASLDPRLPGTMIDLLRAGADGMDALRRVLDGKGNRIPLVEVTLLAPVPRSSLTASPCISPRTSSARDSVRSPTALRLMVFPS